MRNERHETVAGIVAEMRECADSTEKHDLYDLRECATDYLRILADRIEAAHNRELESTVEKSSVVGNSAKMREALSDACYAMFNFLKTQNGGYEEMSNALDKAKAALAKPPRNCDVVTAEEKFNRFDRWCNSMVIKNCCGVDCRKCFIAWWQMPYDEGGAK